MKKKVYKYIGMFALVLSFLVMPLNIVQAENIDVEPKFYTYGDFRYKYVKDTDYIEIVGYIGTDEKVVYPSEIEGKKVYSISCHSTYSSRDVLMVKEVVIPNGVKKIMSMGLFSNLENVQLPESMEEIGVAAFHGCEKLERVIIPLNVKTIGMDAFYNCKNLKEIYIPNSVSTIESLAFAGCSGLKKVVLSSGLKKIEKEAFSGCTSLKEIQIPDTVTKIEEAAFWFCTKLTKVKLSKNLTVIDENTFYNCNIKSIEIPKKVKKIGVGAFMENAFTSITIPSKVTYIGGSAFNSCKKLKKITIKAKNIKQIRKGAFYNINKKATFDVPNKCKKKYKKMLIKANSFKEGKMKIK